MAEIKIPFNTWSRKKLSEKKKWVTSRNKKYGEVGDRFKVLLIDDSVGEYEITEIGHFLLYNVAYYCYTQEGAKSPEEFIEIWNEIHPRKKYDPLHRVWYHKFKRLDVGPNEITPLMEINKFLPCRYGLPCACLYICEEEDKLKKPEDTKKHGGGVNMTEIVLDGWAGIVKYPVEMVGETPKRFRVRWILDEPFTPPRGGTLRYKGDEFLVPKHAVRFT